MQYSMHKIIIQNKQTRQFILEGQALMNFDTASSYLSLNVTTEHTIKNL